MTLEDKIRIYLTDQLVGRPNINKLSKEVMLAVADFYKSPSQADGYRKNRFTDWHRPAWDSGGFQFLMGKLDNPDPMKTVDLYQRIGVTEKDLPIQLDLPPQYILPSEERMALVYKSAEYYWRMAEEIPFIVPVVHGWTLEEATTSLRLLDDPDLLGCGAMLNVGGTGVDNVTSNKSCLSAGTFTSKMYPWSMGNLNPHSCAKERIATPFPNPVDFGAKPVVQKVVSSTETDRVAAGTFIANSTSRGAQNTKAKKKEEPKQQVSIKVIIERLAMVLNLLRDRELFMLGGASPNMQHLVFLGGAKYSDTSAWRLKGYFGSIYIPEVGSRSIGYKETDKRITSEETKILAECLRENTHPLEGMKVDRFLTIGGMNMTEWRETWEANEWEVKPFPLRSLHNAWVLKQCEEVIANEYANDPDRYYEYLSNRFDGNGWLTNRLEHLWKRLRRPWVQTKMGVYLKGEKP
jgi:hypothetical protein